MKASIITLHTSDNYGSALQTYATQKVFESLDYEAEFVDYWRKNNTYDARTEQSLLHGQAAKLKFLWGLTPFTRKWMYEFVKKRKIQNQASKWDFLEKYVHLTPKRYYSLEELKKDTPVADVYVTGSDQVWNSIWNGGIDKVFFLDYAPAGKKRIAFSASIGRTDMDEEERRETKKLLETYDAISVRESSAVELLRSMGIESTLILDPTLMLDQEAWQKLATMPRKMKKPYLLIYQLNPNKDMDDYAHRLAKKKGWEVVRIGMNNRDRFRTGHCLWNPPVTDLLGLWSHSACTLTDSFHATAFALNLGRDFISVPPPRFSTRLESILQLTGTQDRMLQSYDDLELADKKIDKEKVKRILDEKRAEGMQWLKQALAEE